MWDLKDPTLLISGTSLAAAATLAIPTLRYMILRQSHPKSGWGPEQRQPNGEGPDLYRDKDGVTTPDAQAKFSNTPAKVFCLVTALAGLGLATTLTVLGPQVSSIERELMVENWTMTAGWALALFQAIVIAACPDSVRAYYLGLYGLGIAWFIMVGTLYLNTQRATEIYETSRAAFNARMGGVFLSLIQQLAFGTLPRRPTVFDKDGVEVDRWHTFSGLFRLTINWDWPLWLVARRTGYVEVEDMTRVPHKLRSQDARERMAAVEYDVNTEPLWKLLWRVNKCILVEMWVMSSLAGIATYGQMWAMLFFMRILEQKAEGAPATMEMWVMVLWCTIASVTLHMVHEVNVFTVWTSALLTVRTQLTTLIFDKITRRVMTSGRSDQEHEGPKSNGPKSGDKPAKAKGGAAAAAATTAAKADDSADEQSISNVIGVDVETVVHAVCLQAQVVKVMWHIVLAFPLLISIFGWIPVVFSVMPTFAIFVPASRAFGLNFALIQKRIMKERDGKLALITEAVHGARQIKFSSVEREWEGRIMEIRDREIAVLRYNIWMKMMLQLCSVGLPLGLGTISLGLYSWINGSLTPSVAFVGLSVIFRLSGAYWELPVRCWPFSSWREKSVY